MARRRAPLHGASEADRQRRAWRIAFALFVVAASLLTIWALIPELFGHGKGKDYPLWYDVGRQALVGGELYGLDETGTFRFLYPPLAAVLLAPFTLLGRAGMILALCLITGASWWISARLSDRLAGVAGFRPWWVLALPATLSLPFFYDMYDLGQPNLMLLAMMLAGLALLQGRREWAAGACFALAAALKAFPVAVLPYLLWRRRWRAAGSMTALTLVLLVLVPAPLRGFERNLADLRTWAGGMVFSASETGFGQRPEQNWSWKNNSLIALTHRYVRPVDAEAVDPGVRPLSVNVLDLSYGEANLVVLALAAAIGLAFVAVLPPERLRTPASDGAEFALLISLMTIASPLARAYYFVWLLFPFTVLVYHAALDPDRKARRLIAGLLALALGLFCLGAPLPPPHIAQALGNMFWATAVIMGALAWLLRRETKRAAAAT